MRPVIVQHRLPARALHLGRIVRIRIERGRHPRAALEGFEQRARHASVREPQRERARAVHLLVDAREIETRRAVARLHARPVRAAHAQVDLRPGAMPVRSGEIPRPDRLRGRAGGPGHLGRHRDAGPDAEGRQGRHAGGSSLRSVRRVAAWCHEPDPGGTRGRPLFGGLPPSLRGSAIPGPQRAAPVPWQTGSARTELAPSDGRGQHDTSAGACPCPPTSYSPPSSSA